MALQNWRHWYQFQAGFETLETSVDSRFYSLCSSNPVKDLKILRLFSVYFSTHTDMMDGIFSSKNEISFLALSQAPAVCQYELRVMA